MNRSRDVSSDLLPEHSAVQHEHAPRPLPLFLELVRQVSERDPELAGDALSGLRAYEAAERIPRAAPMPEIARMRGACLRDHGGGGPPPGVHPPPADSLR